MNQIFDSTNERFTIRHLTGQVRSVSPTNVLSIAYTVHIRFVRYTSVTHTAKSVS